MKQEIKQTERGWGGHFCGVALCRFRRSTLLEYNEIRVIVSTVGNYQIPNWSKIERLNLTDYYETKVFYAKQEYEFYWDADVEKDISDFDSNCGISEITIESDFLANNMHEIVISEIKEKMLKNII